MKKEIEYNTILEEQIELGEVKYISIRNNDYIIIRYNDYANITDSHVIEALEHGSENNQSLGLAHIIACEFSDAESARTLIDHIISICSEYNIIIASVNKYAKYFEQNRFMKIISSKSIPSINLYKNLNTFIYIKNATGREAYMRAMFGIELDIAKLLEKQDYIIDIFNENELDYDNVIIMPLNGRNYIIVWYTDPKYESKIIGRYPVEIISGFERPIPESDGLMYIALDINVDESDWTYDPIAEKYYIIKSISRAIDNIIYAPDDLDEIDCFDITIEDNDLKIYSDTPQRFAAEVTLRAIIV